MRIGELAQQAGLTAKTIRFYEQAGVLPDPERLSSGYRTYDEASLARLRFVRAAQAAGLTLAEIRSVLAVREQGRAPCQHVVDLLQAQASDLERRIADLAALRDETTRLLAVAADLDPNACDADADAVCRIIASPAISRGVEREPAGGDDAPRRRVGSPTSRR